MSRSSIWHIDRILLGVTTPGRSRPDNNGNKGVLHIPQSFKTGALPSGGLMSYPGHALGEFYLSAEMQSVYSTAPADWIRYTTKIHQLQKIPEGSLGVPYGFLVV